MKTIEKTTKESLQLLGRCYGQMAHIEYIHPSPYWNYERMIAWQLLHDIESKQIESFRITSLRTMEQMTEEEKAHYLSLKDIFSADGNGCFYADTAESIHYLDSIGVTTDQNLLSTIIIKD